MSAPLISYEMQRASVEHAIALLSSRAAHIDVSPSVIESLKAAALSIGLLERYRDVARELARLHRDSPEVAETMQAIFSAFPGATISGARHGK